MFLIACPALQSILNNTRVPLDCSAALALCTGMSAGGWDVDTAKCPMKTLKALANKRLGRVTSSIPIDRKNLPSAKAFLIELEK